MISEYRLWAANLFTLRSKVTPHGRFEAGPSWISTQAMGIGTAEDYLRPYKGRVLEISNCSKWNLCEWLAVNELTHRRVSIPLAGVKAF